MHKFMLGDFVRHTENDTLLFRVEHAMESVPAGGPSLYECSAVGQAHRVYRYNEDDLYVYESGDEHDELSRKRTALAIRCVRAEYALKYFRYLVKVVCDLYENTRDEFHELINSDVRDGVIRWHTKQAFLVNARSELPEEPGLILDHYLSYLPDPQSARSNVMQSLELHGDVQSRRFIVVVNGERRHLQGTPYENLLDLIAARRSTEKGYLPNRKSITAAGDPNYPHQLAFRLNKQLGGDLVEAGIKSYRVVADRDHIYVGPGVFETGEGVINPRVLERLKAAMEKIVTQVK